MICGPQHVFLLLFCVSCDVRMEDHGKDGIKIGPLWPILWDEGVVLARWLASCASVRGGCFVVVMVV